MKPLYNMVPHILSTGCWKKTQEPQEMKLAKKDLNPDYISERCEPGNGDTLDVWTLQHERILQNYFQTPK